MPSSLYFSKLCLKSNGYSYINHLCSVRTNAVLAVPAQLKYCVFTMFQELWNEMNLSTNKCAS